MVESADIIEEALSIPEISAGHLILDDFRRLTGPGLLWDEAGAVLDIFYKEIDPAYLKEKWQHHIKKVLSAVNWGHEKIIIRDFDGWGTERDAEGGPQGKGVNVAISAPMDQLYSAMFAALTAWHFCAGDILAQETGDFDIMIADLKSVMKREANPALIDLIKAAKENNVDLLSDDDEVSLGHGIGSICYNVMDLPAPQDVPWDKLHDIPIAMITGTNGKTTTARLAAAIGKASGKISGLTSTDFVRVGDDILDRGDYSGPGGGRMLLRDKRLEVAYLEVARGGILRRGLPLRQAKAAIVTNIAADHLGQFGVNKIEDLAVAKFAVHRTLSKDGILVLNADDPYVIQEASRTNATICWFSLDPSNEKIIEAKENGALCAWLDADMLTYFDGSFAQNIMTAQDIPLTLNGAARHNILNALGAICLSRAMGLSDEAIRLGLSQFKNDPKDNPGRCNEFSVKEARVFVDFAHNPHSVEAMIKTMAAIPANKRYILLSHAGDRSNQDIRDVTRSALDLKPDFIMATELEDYLRGRAYGEVPALIKDEALKQGLHNNQILEAGSPLEGAEKILDRLEKDDLALLLILSNREQVFALLEKESTMPTA